MIKIVTAPLAGVAHLFETFVEIAEDVYTEAGADFDTQSFYDHLKRFSRLGHSAAIAYDGEEVVGFTLAGTSDPFIETVDWIPIKVELVLSGYKLDEMFTAHSVCVRPSYWKQGLTRKLMAAAVSTQDRQWFLIVNTLTEHFEDWLLSFPGTFDTGLRSKIGRRVILQPWDALGGEGAA